MAKKKAVRTAVKKAVKKGVKKVGDMLKAGRKRRKASRAKIAKKLGMK